MLAKRILTLAYLMMSTYLFATLVTDISVWISFFISNLILFGIFYWHLYQEKEFSPFLSVFFVFSFLFFIVSPVLQVGEIGFKNGKFPTELIFHPEGILFTNILVITFNLTFTAAYLLFKKSRLLRSIPQYKGSYLKKLPLLIAVLTVITVFIFLGSFSFVREEISRPSETASSASIGLLLLWKKVLFMVPFAGVILCFQYFKKKGKLASNMIIIGLLFLALLLFLLWFKNPLTEKRNALGPIYICIIYLFVPRLLNSNVKMTLFMFFSMVVVFPLSAMITHVRATLREIIIQPRILLDGLDGYGISEVFNTLHYDAFINITASVDYVKYEGFAYGYQLLSAFLFFVPRSIWSDKPLNTGFLVGDHLIDYYGFNYNNLSNPLVSEGYINFGMFGVMIMAVLLALVCIKLLSWFKSDDYIKKILGLYFAVHLLFLLRGDFTNGYSYYVGIFVGVYVVIRLTQYGIDQLFINQALWKQKQQE